MMKRRQNGGGPRLPLQLQKELRIGHPAAGLLKWRTANDAHGARRKVGRNPARQTKLDGGSKRFEEESSMKSGRKDRQIDASQSVSASSSAQQGVDHMVNGSEGDKPTASTSHARDTLPDLKLDRSSKTFRYRAAEDDAEIAALEKKLRVKGRKRPEFFHDDGLDGLLMDLVSTNESDGGEADDELQHQRPSKRRRVSRYSKSQLNDKYQNDQMVGEPNSSATSSELDSDETPSLSVSENARAKRENPYVAPPSTEQGTADKYVAPSRRAPGQSELHSSQRLRRQIQGQINRLSETNMLSILREVEKLYQQNARQEVTSALTDQLLIPFCERSALQTTFTILHAAFLTAMYKVVGTEFGVHVVSIIVQRLEHFQEDQENAGKQSVNLLSLLCHLYTFRMFSSHLIFDHIGILLQKLNERNSEMLLRVVRDSGPQLRQDDPSSLKAAVSLVQNEMAQAREKGQAISVRTQFMVETIIDLKNNKLRHETGSHGVAKEHIVVLRKLLGSMASRSLRASEPMRLGISDLKDAGKRGQWLRSTNGTGIETHQDEDNHEEAKEIDPEFPQSQAGTGVDDPDFLELARQNGMNTTVRRAIFTAIISANDHEDARARLLGLRLKKSQQQEIPRVLLHCIGLEEQYNPYYTLIAKELCLDKKLKMAFQFALWNFFKRMGETGEAPDDLDSEREEVQPQEVINTAKTYGAMIIYGVLSLDILKVLNLRCPTAQTSLFLELMLGSIFLRCPEGDDGVQPDISISKIFSRHLQNPQLASGLRHFLGKVVKYTELFDSKKEAKLIKRGCAIAIDTLKGVGSVSQAIE